MQHRKSQAVEISGGHGIGKGRCSAEPPRSPLMSCRASSQIMTEIQLSQPGISRLPCSPLLAGSRAYTTPDPLIETVQHGRGLAEPKITLPSLKVAAHIANHSLDTDASGSTSEGSDSCLESEHCLGRDSALRHSPIRKAKPEELPLPRSCYSTPLPVHLQLKFAFEEFCESPHQALTRSLTTDVDIAVVRISNKTMPSSLQLPVKLVENEIRQQRRNHAPYTKGNFQFERTVTGWRTRYPVLDLRLKR